MQTGWWVQKNKKGQEEGGQGEAKAKGEPPFSLLILAGMLFIVSDGDEKGRTAPNNASVQQAK